MKDVERDLNEHQKIERLSKESNVDNLKNDIEKRLWNDVDKKIDEDIRIKKLEADVKREKTPHCKQQENIVELHKPQQKLSTKDSAMWDKATKNRNLKQKVKKEKLRLEEYQYSLGGKEKPKEHLKYKFKTDELKLIGFGDWHYGAPNCDVNKIKKTIDYIKESGAQVILMGDLIENANKYSVGSGVYDQDMTPQRQLDHVCKMLEPIKGQILGNLTGNHEFRTQKDSGFNPTILISDRLGVPYCGFKTFIDIRVNKHKYIVYATHGSTGARLPWTRMKAVDDVARNIDADIVMYAHTHDMFSKPFVREGIRDRKGYEVLTGGFLKDTPYGYAAMKNYPPLKTGVVKLKLFGNKWDIHATS